MLLTHVRRLLRHFCTRTGALLLILTCALPAAAQRGAITAPRNLSEMVDESGIIVRGQVLSARAEPQ